MRRTPSSGCYWGFVLCLRDTLYLFLAIAIIAYALRQIKFTQLLYFLYVSLNFLRNFYFYAFYTFFFFFYLFIRHIDIYMFPMINFLKNLQRKGRFFYEQIQADSSQTKKQRIVKSFAFFTIFFLRSLL